MYINEIQVKNFRQLKNVSISLQNNTTILAGPNNSGKTSFILLLKRIFSDSSFTCSEEDFNVYDKKIWTDQMYSDLKEIYEKNKNKLEEEIQKIVIDKMAPWDEKNWLQIPELEVRFQVDYSEKDNISNVADYIMDLEISQNSIYFIFRTQLNRSQYPKIISDNWLLLKSKLENNSGDTNKSVIKKILLDIYCKSLESKCYFSDKDYKVESEIHNIQQFKNIFFFKYIEAARPVDDSLAKDERKLSNALLDMADQDADWKNKMEELPEQIFDILTKSKIKEEVAKISTATLNDFMNEIAKTGGRHIQEINFHVDVDGDDIKKLIRGTTDAKYEVTGSDGAAKYILGETAQGLGYSNLVYMHTQIDNFIKAIDDTKVNFLVIEEPESHMHPQMQYVFAKKLSQKFDMDNMQGLLTTHSDEIVRGTDIERLRVIREHTLFNSTVYDLSSFINKVKIPKNALDEDSTMVKSFKSFYQVIGISQIVFADAVILFEGDTERLYLKKLLELDEYNKLQQLYIAYVQVGGAYAYNFKPLLEYLEIKSLIITDVDYDKDVKSKKEILLAKSSNETIDKFFYENRFGSVDNVPANVYVRVQQLYRWIKDSKHIVSTIETTDLLGNSKKEELIYLAFQTDDDNYTRTLEAAMLSRKFNISGDTKQDREWWEDKRKETKLKFGIPGIKTKSKSKSKSKQTYSLIDILEATSGKKTDFMNSVVLHDYSQEMLPDYIKEGLEWLMQMN